MNRIKSMRRAKNWSQWDLATATDRQVSQSTISLIELGHRVPSDEQLESLAKALQTTPEELRGAKTSRAS